MAKTNNASEPNSSRRPLPDQAIFEPTSIKSYVAPSLALRVLTGILGLGLIIFGLALAIPAELALDPYLLRGALFLLIFGGCLIFMQRLWVWNALKAMGVWLLMLIAVSGFYFYKSELGGRIYLAFDPDLPVAGKNGLYVQKASDGHFWLQARVNGVSIPMMVDTGASNMVLSPEDAQKIGLDVAGLDFSRKAETANGSVTFARTSVARFELGHTAFMDVPVTVNGAEMRGSLLGMEILNRFASIEFRGDVLILKEK